MAKLLDEAPRTRPAAPLPALEDLAARRREGAAAQDAAGVDLAEGYALGAFSSPIYPDALEAMRRWRGEGLSLYVYSSGSLAAQELFFQNSAAGDLRPLFAGRFDATVARRGAGFLCARRRASALRRRRSSSVPTMRPNSPPLWRRALQVLRIVKDGAKPDPPLASLRRLLRNRLPAALSSALRPYATTGYRH